MIEDMTHKCVWCGEKFERTHRLQKYCPACRKKYRTEYDRAKNEAAKTFISEGKISDWFVKRAKNQTIYRLRNEKPKSEIVFSRYVSTIGRLLAMEQYMKELKQGKIFK
jgi:predicted  nucleic acid-binding Zn-ribbon protein